MGINPKVMQIFNYLHSIKNLNHKKVRNISEYEEVFYQNEICNLEGVTLINNDENDSWLEITKDSKELYKKFSKLYLTLEKNSENLEVVYGHGLLVGNLGGAKIVHPILTTKMDLIFNDKASVFYLRPYNNVTNIELDMLSDLEEEVEDENKETLSPLRLSAFNFSLQNIINASEKAKALGINPRKEEEVKEALCKINEELNLNLSKEELYNKIQSLLELEGDEKINIYNEPVIIFRKLDTRLWNMELNTALQKLNEDFKVPRTIEALVTEEKLSLSKEELESWREIGEELLFPLPYNEEQKEITKRLSENFGVVVQGPPGTGKSHTIVNLICHLLAHGKRVLVTSQTDRALKVLNNKIPEEIKSLCISILGDDSKAMEELDEAVRKVTENLSLDTGVLKGEIKALKYNLNLCKHNKQSLLDTLKKVYIKESSKVSYKGQDYYVADMAKFLKENLDTLSFIDDNIPLNHEETLTNEEFQKLLRLYKGYSKQTLDLYETSRNILDKAPSKAPLIEAMEKHKESLKSICKHRELVGSWNYKEVTSFTNSNLLATIDDAIEMIKRYEDTLLEPIFNGIYENPGKKEFWKEFQGKLEEELKEVYKLKNSISKYKILIPENHDGIKLKKDFEVVYNALASKGKIGAMFKLFHKDLGYILQEILIDGEKLTSLEQGKIIKDYLDLQKLEKGIKNYYNSAVGDYGIPLITGADSNYLKPIEDFRREIQRILDFEENQKNKVLNLLKVKKFNRELNFYKKESYEYLKEVLTSLKFIKEFEEGEKYLEEVKRSLNKHSSFKELLEKIQELNLDNVKKYYEAVEYLKLHRGNLEEALSLTKKLITLCPRFENSLRGENLEDLSKKYKDFQGAVKYSAFNNYIKELLHIDVKVIEKELCEGNEKENYLIKELVAKKSWYNQIMRTTEAQKRSLFTWMEAIKRIGKGTGSQAVKYRKVAQSQMESCKDVIPVWIMPINRVIENLKLNEALFDVVIVDESSQSDVSALTVLMRAERAVIVGDEKQISPEAIGKSPEVIEKLIDAHLEGIPHKEWFDLKTSLYTTAQRIFPNRLVLKEHFRSLEEIIGFSNKLCYSGEIIPLRCSSKKNGLDQIKPVRVEEGFRDKTKAINIKEAYEVVEAIKNCCEDPAYEGMTMGVISLLGEMQAEFIENMLIEKIGIEEMVRRNIVCGDAYSFQGDERDVMFLSMVVSSNVKFAALSKDSDIRRFNVAASRAKNQMWLFHSVDLEELSPKCVRRNLLDYMENYNKEDLAQREAAVTLMLSSLEEDLLEALEEQGLQVTPHFRISKYLIDFVINEDKKLALKAIGKNNHMPYNHEEEYYSELTLERAGWKFLKVRGSEFYLNKEDVIKRIKGQIKGV